MKKREPTSGLMLWIAVLLLAVYNVVYWVGKFFPKFIPAVTEVRTTLVEHWGLMMFLELLAVISLFVDIVVRWDEFPKRERNLRLLMTGFFVCAFMARFGFGVMDMYMIGDVQ
jgi:hypothetical protein